MTMRGLLVLLLLTMGLCASAQATDEQLAAQYMQAAVPPGVGAMAAILKMPSGALEGVLAEAA